MRQRLSLARLIPAIALFSTVTLGGVLDAHRAYAMGEHAPRHASQSTPPTVLPVPTPTSAAASGCPGCGNAVLKLINGDRARYGLHPLQLQGVLSAGRGACSGAYGHSKAMASTGTLWHDNTRFPQASFPNDICVRSMHIAENVGMAESGDVQADLLALDRMMMSEPHGKAQCATGLSHACNILSADFHHVGIGVYRSAGITWLTEDFTD